MITVLDMESKPQTFTESRLTSFRNALQSLVSKTHSDLSSFYIYRVSCVSGEVFPAIEILTFSNSPIVVCPTGSLAECNALNSYSFLETMSLNIDKEKFGIFDSVFGDEQLDLIEEAIKSIITR